MFPWSFQTRLSRVSLRSITSDCAAFELAATTRWSPRKLNWSAMKRVMELFERQQCFVAHLEGGRTSKQAEHVSVGPNKMGKIRNAQILKAAWKKGAWILPLHVKMTDDMKRDLPGLARVRGACCSVRNAGRSDLSFAVPTRSSDGGSTKKQKRDAWNWRFSHPRCRHDPSATRCAAWRSPRRRTTLCSAHFVYFVLSYSQ